MLFMFSLFVSCCLSLLLFVFSVVVVVVCVPVVTCHVPCCHCCRRKKKCVRYSEDDEDAPKEMHGALEDDVIGTPTKNSEDCAINSNGYSSSAATVTVATISETKTGIKSESSSYGQDTPTISHQSELSVPITLQTIPT